MVSVCFSIRRRVGSARTQYLFALRKMMAEICKETGIFQIELNITPSAEDVSLIK
jgi:hypothetical protein